MLLEVITFFKICFWFFQILVKPYDRTMQGVVTPFLSPPQSLMGGGGGCLKFTLSFCYAHYGFIVNIFVHYKLKMCIIGPGVCMGLTYIFKNI
jgi:hypothetical protein